MGGGLTQEVSMAMAAEADEVLSGDVTALGTGGRGSSNCSSSISLFENLEDLLDMRIE